MAAGRKSHDADAVRIDRVFAGMRAHVADGSLGIEQRDGIVVARAVAVGQHKGRHSTVIEPLGDQSAFFIDGKLCISSAGADDDCRMRGILRG